MALADFKQLADKYDNFQNPSATVMVNNKIIPSGKAQYVVSDIEVDLTSGFEASMASFCIYDVYDGAQASFIMDDVKKDISLGSKVDIYMGYRGTKSQVFVGLIAKVSFQFLEGEIPCIRVTAMDVKSIMMAGSYHKQLKATTCTAAVKEILEKSAYSKLQGSGIISGIEVAEPVIAPTPASPAGTGASAETIEMVAESDYEFIVKLAKKNNYEFFCDCGKVVFRKPKSVTNPILAITPSMGMHSFDIEYDVTGLSETLVARSVDAGKGTLIEAKNTFSNKISLGNKANNLIKGSQHVYVDPTISSSDDAQARVDSMLEDMAFRFGTLQCEMVGIPEVRAGFFFDIQYLGEGPSNIFYLTNVKHRVGGDGTYTMQLTGKASSLL